MTHSSSPGDQAAQATINSNRNCSFKPAGDVVKIEEILTDSSYFPDAGPDHRFRRIRAHLLENLGAPKVDPGGAESKRPENSFRILICSLWNLCITNVSPQSPDHLEKRRNA
jgi:hypothetical protein